MVHIEQSTYDRLCTMITDECTGARRKYSVDIQDVDSIITVQVLYDSRADWYDILNVTVKNSQGAIVFSDFNYLKLSSINNHHYAS